MKVNKWLVAGIVGLTGLGLLTGCGDKKETASTSSSSEVQQKTPTAEEPFIEGVPMDYYDGKEEKEMKKPDLHFVPIEGHKVKIYDVSYNNDGEKEGLQDYKYNDPKFTYTTTLPYKIEKTDHEGVYQIIMQATDDELDKLPELMDNNHNEKNQIIYGVTEKNGQLYAEIGYRASYNMDLKKTIYRKNDLSRETLLKGDIYLAPSHYTDK